MQSNNPVEKYSQNILLHQTAGHDDPELFFLNQIVSKVIAKSIYDKSEKLKYLGTTSIIFPSNYREIRMQLGTNISAPSTHQTEIIIRGNHGSSVEVIFNYLQPKIRRLSEKGEDRFNNIPSKILEIDGVKYKAGNEDPVVKSFSTDKILIADLLNKPFEKIITERKTEERLDIKDCNGVVKGRLTYVTENLNLLFKLTCIQLENPIDFKITIRVTNTNNISIGRGRLPYNLDEVMEKSIFGAYSLINCHNCEVLPNKGDLAICTNLNTHPHVSPNDSSVIESSPIIIHDEPWIMPVKMRAKLEDLTNNVNLFLENALIINESYREQIVESGKLKQLQNIFKALYKSSPTKFEYLYQFQWDGIMTFINGLFENKHGAMVIRAPTGSGKSVVFYVCSVIEKIFSDNHEGTKTFITFPTRALNSQQFSEMVSFFYHLNNQGIRATLGLFMGQDTDSAVRAMNIKDVKPGEEITLIERCPECKMNRIIADIKDGKNRILPKCDTCGVIFDFLYLSNNETTGYCPNVVVGTPDKLVNALTHDEKSHVLFGARSKRCPNCGFHYPLCQKDQNYETHSCKECATEMGSDAIVKSSPHLIVFDEIHTLVGTQGNLLGHFLSLLKVLGSVYGIKNDYRYLGATATISNQDELIENITGYHKDLQINFPPDEQFYSIEDKKGYFVVQKNRIRHRYVVMEPLGVSTRASVRSVVHSLYSYLSQIKNDHSQKNFLQSYGNQTIYVLRKDDGRDLEKDIPDYIVQTGLSRPKISFGSGDLSNTEISTLNKLVRANKLDILIVTQIYGQGVDFPGLNIIHFFGVPRSFIEFSQVVGRTGRGDVPGLVFIHVTPHLPRDQWVYRNFRHMIENMGHFYEPTPINVANKYAISLSIPNVFNTLIMARSYQDHQYRFADHVHQSLVGNRESLKKVLEEVIETYDRSSMSSEEKTELRTNVFESVTKILLDFRGSNNRTSDHLKTKKLLVPTLRAQKKSIRYTEQVKYPILEQLLVSRGVEEE